MPKISLTSVINVNSIGPESLNVFKFVASKEERQTLKTRFEFLDLLSLSAELTVCKTTCDCWYVKGQLIGVVVQACRSTGTPLRETVDFLIEERYVRSVNSHEEVEVYMDVAEPLENEAINIGELLAQSLGVAVTAWPRVDGAPETYTSGEGLPDHPFAELAVLKRQVSE